LWPECLMFSGKLSSLRYIYIYIIIYTKCFKTSMGEIIYYLCTIWLIWCLLFMFQGGPMQCYSSNQCLEATETNTVLLTACDKEKSAQRWKFNTYSNKLYSILRTKPAKKKNYYWYTLYMEHIQTEGNLTI